MDNTKVFEKLYLKLASEIEIKTFGVKTRSNVKELTDAEYGYLCDFCFALCSDDFRRWELQRRKDFIAFLAKEAHNNIDRMAAPYTADAEMG